MPNAAKAAIANSFRTFTLRRCVGAGCNTLRYKLIHPFKNASPKMQQPPGFPGGCWLPGTRDGLLQGHRRAEGEPHRVDRGRAELGGLARHQVAALEPAPEGARQVEAIAPGQLQS